MKRIIILGAAGLVGLSLVSKIDSKKYKAIAVDKNKNNMLLAKEINSGIEVHNYDLSVKNSSWEKLFKGAYCVIQLQAQISHETLEPYIKNNITSIQNVVDICKKYKIKNLIHISSSVVIAISKDNYSNTKTAGEEIVKKSSVPHTILRPPLMYGCFDIKHLLPIVKFLDKSPVLPLPGKADFLRQPLYVGDLVNIILKLIETKPKNKIYNLIGKEKIEFGNLIKIISKEQKRKAFFINVPIPLFLFMLKFHGFLTGKKPFVKSQLNALMAGDIFPVDDWEKEFGVRYTSFRKGVKEFVNSRHYNYSYRMKKDD